MHGPSWVSSPCLCSELGQAVTAGGPSSHSPGWRTAARCGGRSGRGTEGGGGTLAPAPSVSLHRSSVFISPHIPYVLFFWSKVINRYFTKTSDNQTRLPRLGTLTDPSAPSLASQQRLCSALPRASVLPPSLLQEETPTNRAPLLADNPVRTLLSPYLELHCGRETVELNRVHFLTSRKPSQCNKKLCGHPGFVH